ncbi:arylformamidase [Sulfoacidibacillus ferrooxidans]|uniref:Kynurenine formamidase n=1 Tax=Sulfoacidibacillus ferrooxidans TaxID=2005001 RepID=A0A9X2AAK7_9BACL|nr:arylformamidase [Sulfoacidibacillus ferrooxidans]MCI0181958.1 Kynurenine formamidase [Sulfoacidibacillus ferrooxidans]
MSHWLDISAPLSVKTASFPGDTPFTRIWTSNMNEGAICNVSAFSMSPHVGTHADAPYHYGDEGATMEEADLSLYIGRARVIDVSHVNGLITKEDLAQHDLRSVSRLLVRTNSYPDIEYFTKTYSAFAPDAVDYLAELGIRLVGIDTPSVDPSTSKDLPAHQRFRIHGMRILETLRLAHVDCGDYELIALPLRIVGSDASPIRAVLRAV